MKKSTTKNENERFLTAYYMGWIFGMIVGASNSFLYITGVFLLNWPLAFKLLFGIVTGAPSMLIEIWVASFSLAFLFESGARLIATRLRKKGEAQTHAHTSDNIKNKTQKKSKATQTQWDRKHIQLWFKNIAKNGLLFASLFLNASGQAVFAWATLTVFFGVALSFTGPAAFLIALIMAFFVFSGTTAFSFLVLRHQLKKTDIKSISEELAQKEQRASKPNQTKKVKSSAKSRLISLATIVFGIAAGTATASITFMAITHLPFTWPVILTLLVVIGTSILITQILSAYECFKQWETADDFTSTKALVTTGFLQRLAGQPLEGWSEKEKVCMISAIDESLRLTHAQKHGLRSHIEHKPDVPFSTEDRVQLQLVVHHHNDIRTALQKSQLNDISAEYPRTLSKPDIQLLGKKNPFLKMLEKRKTKWNTFVFQLYKKYPKTCTYGIYLFKASALLLKAASVAFFVGLSFAGFFSTMGVFLPVGVTVAISAMAASLSLLNTYSQNHYILFKKEDDLAVIRNGNNEIAADDPDICHKIELFFSYESHEKSLNKKQALSSCERESSVSLKAKRCG